MRNVIEIIERVRREIEEEAVYEAYLAKVQVSTDQLRMHSGFVGKLLDRDRFVFIKLPGSDDLTWTYDSMVVVFDDTITPNSALIEARKVASA